MSKNLGAKEIEQKRRDIDRWAEEIYYSPRYNETAKVLQQAQGSAGRKCRMCDSCRVKTANKSHDEFEYRHVIIPKALVKYLPTDRLAEEDEWRGLGIRQSPGWEHYLRHAPEPHILLFKREKDYGM